MGNAADALQDPSILRLENLDTDIAPLKVAVDVTRNGIDVDENNSYLPIVGQNELRKAALVVGFASKLYNGTISTRWLESLLELRSLPFQP